MSPKISVIIPVYNTAAYLPRCLDSVLGQTLKGIEVICVDDGSTDGSAAILADSAAKDFRLKVITFPENRGAAVARNAGLEVATGEYVGFIDSDDWPEADFYSRLYQAAKESDADAAKGDYRSEDGSVMFSEQNRRIREDKNAFSVAYCSAIFRRRVIGSLRFPQLIDMEDPVFAFSFALRANRIVLVDDCFVNITCREGSQTRMRPSHRRLADCVRGLSKISELADAAGERLSPRVRIDTMACWTRMIVALGLTSGRREAEFVLDGVRAILERSKMPAEFFSLLQREDAQLSELLRTGDRNLLVRILAHHRVMLLMQRARTPAIKVSVIIPVYNTAAYLPRCLDSVCNQALKDLEIICVNDASPDNSAEILAEYARRDPRVKVIAFEQNRGVGAARNAGIEAATGEYVGFVDSDDFVDGDFYEKLLEPRRDLVLGNLVEERYDERGTVVETLNSAWYGKVRHDVLKYRVGFFGIFYVALYRRDLIVRNKIRFAENRVVGEDRLFPVLAEYHAESPIVRDDTFYHYCDRAGSAARRKVNGKIAEGVVGFVGDVAEFLKHHRLTDDEMRFLVNHTFVDALFGPALRTAYAEIIARTAGDFYREFQSICDYRESSVAAMLAAMRSGQGYEQAMTRIKCDAMRANVLRKAGRIYR